MDDNACCALYHWLDDNCGDFAGVLFEQGFDVLEAAVAALGGGAIETVRVRRGRKERFEEQGLKDRVEK